MSARNTDDVLIVGGGVIGLALAYELAERGAGVRIVERGEPGREASWAGAGILPPASEREGDHPYEQLRGLSSRLHAEWARKLRDETGIDNGYLHCGALYVARDETQLAILNLLADYWQTQGVRRAHVAPQEIAELEPVMVAEGRPTEILDAWRLDDECQLRNPWHVRALVSACRNRGVEIVTGMPVDEFEIRADRIDGVRTTAGVLRAEQYCLTAGAWSSSLLRRLGYPLAIRPVRGQIVLLETRGPRLHRVINEGPRYLVPRSDGRVLIGSTEEEAGFDKRTTAESVRELIALALSLAPGLADATVERTWAGLRPATSDGLPVIGRLPGLKNGFVATGHFRSGLQLSTGTAQLLSQLILGLTPPIDLSPFRADRW